MVFDRAGITGDDGPSHHGVLDMALSLSIPGMTVFAPSSAPEVEVMLAEALTLDGPSVIRFPKTPAPWVAPGTVGTGLRARKVPRRRRLGVHARRGQDGDRGGGGGRPAGRRGHRDDRVGPPGGLPPRSRHGGRRRQPRPGRDRGGRHPPGWRGHVPRRRHPEELPAGRRSARGQPRDSPPVLWPRASPTGSWPSWAWTPLGLATLGPRSRPCVPRSRSTRSWPETPAAHRLRYPPRRSTRHGTEPPVGGTRRRHQGWLPPE